MGATGHMTVYRGKRVRIYRYDGSVDVRRYSHKTSKSVHFLDGTKVACRDIRTLTIHKGT